MMDVSMAKDGIHLDPLHPDEQFAWSALLQARARWRGADGLATLEWRDERGPVLQLRADGTWSCDTVLAPAAETVLAIFMPLLARSARSGVVIAHLGQSLDGRIATESGHSHYVNGPQSLRHLHRLRALVDAVIVGVGTVEADNPRLTVRHCEGRDPLRVVIDPDRRLDGAQHMFAGGGATSVTICARDRLGAEDRDDAARATIALPRDSGSLSPHAVLAALRARDRALRAILIEGGGITVSRFIAAGAIDVLQLAIAPLIIGSGRPSLTLPPIVTLEHALRVPTRQFALGSDMLVELTLT
jgi:riboflavin-specific deaminase-like protein